MPYRWVGTHPYRDHRNDRVLEPGDTFEAERIAGTGAPLDVGRTVYAFPDRTPRAIRARDEHCTFPGCTNTRFVDGHHVEHWADGGETRMENLVLLCRHHHRLIHEGGFGVEMRAAFSGQIRKK